jgi:cAMP phosphodiesterase
MNASPKPLNGYGNENPDWMSMATATAEPPLAGVTVYIIHVKDTYEDGPDIGEVILKELEEQAIERNLGVEFVVTSQGGSYFI